MARILRALGFRASSDSKAKEAFDSGNASDTDVEIGCHALRRAAFGSRKKAAFDSRASLKFATPQHQRPQQAPVRRAKGHGSKKSPAVVDEAVKTPTPTPAPASVCAAVDSDYSLPADWCALERDEQPSYATVEQHVAKPADSDNQQLYDPPWTCLDSSLLQQLVGSLQTPIRVDTAQNAEDDPRPKGRVTLERSEQSAFQPVSKRSSVVNPLPSCSPASTRSSVHTASASASAYSSPAGPGNKCATDSWSDSSECRHSNNNAAADCACAECNARQTPQDADVERPGSERLLPRMGVSAMKARGVSASVSAGAGFRATQAVGNSNSFYTRKPVLQDSPQNVPLADDIVWQKVNDAPVTPRRRASQSQSQRVDQSPKHASMAEGPYDCPWDERRARLEALLINNVGLHLDVLRTQDDSITNNNVNIKNNNYKENADRKASQTENLVCLAPQSVLDSVRIDNPQERAELAKCSPHRPVISHTRQFSESPTQVKARPAAQSNTSHASSESPASRHSRNSASKRAAASEVATASKPLQLVVAPVEDSAAPVSPLALYDDRAHPVLNATAATATGNSEIIDPTLPLEEHGWFFASMTRSKAEAAIKEGQEGSFLVRRCETCPTDFSLTIRNKHAQNGIVHMRISRSAKGYILGGYSQPYESVPVLVHHFMFYSLPIRGVPSQVLVHPLCRNALLLKHSPSSNRSDTLSSSDSHAHL